MVITAASPNGLETEAITKSQLADAIGINRQSVPLNESIIKRTEIQKATCIINQPLQVGDKVTIASDMILGAL